jgi:hypothetical protein
VERDDDVSGLPLQTGFATGEAVTIVVPRDGRLVLDTHHGPSALGQELSVEVDGTVVETRRLNVTRGRVRLRLAPGAHAVEVNGPRGFVLTDAVGTGTRFAERVVWRLRRGAALEVPLTTARDASNLNVVLYSDAPLARASRLTARVEIDGGRRGPGVRSAAGRTQLSPEIEAVLEPIESRWLDWAAGPVARTRFAVRLADDIGAGRHRVRVTLLEGPEVVHARFFVTGAAARPAVASATTEWAED